MFNFPNVLTNRACTVHHEPRYDNFELPNEFPTEDKSLTESELVWVYSPVYSPSDFELLTWAYTIIYKPRIKHSDIYTFAIYNKHPSVLRWMYENGYPHDDIHEYCETAATILNRLDILKWFVSIGCTE